MAARTEMVPLFRSAAEVKVAIRCRISGTRVGVGVTPRLELQEAAQT